MSGWQRAKTYLDVLASRRTIHQLGRKPILSDEQTNELIRDVIRASPTAFNSQTSRVVVLLGEEHERYWRDIVRPAVRKAFPDDEAFNNMVKRLDIFQAAHGTALFYEDQAAIQGMQEKVAAYASRFPQWSTEASGMAQINTWVALEAAGYGANLQHYGPLTQEHVAETHKLPKEWKLHAELVFGSPEQEPREKTYIADEERFRFFGAQA